MDIEIIRGTSNNIRVTLRNKKTGGIYNPQPGDTAVFGVKKMLNAAGFVLVKRAEVEEDGTALFMLRPEDTAALCCDKYYYDVGLETGDDFYNVIPATPFRITSNITSRGCWK